MIRIDAAWLATAPLDMRAGTDTALARVITVFGAAHPHHAYVFANQRANRIKILVHDGVGVWLAARCRHHRHTQPNAVRCARAGPALEERRRGWSHHCTLSAPVVGQAISACTDARM